MDKTVNALMAQRNKLEARIMSIQKSIEEDNYEVLVEEALNLLDGVGQGYIAGDHYAPSRYYSQIPGVKNIRFNDAKEDVRLEVKITSPIGSCIPDVINLRGCDMEVFMVASRRYDDEIDY